MVNILVTGGNGQLASCIKSIANNSEHYNFIYSNSKDLDISSENQVNVFFSNHKIDWCINCAAYTAVDKAETEFILAQKINSEGAKNLALACKKHEIKLIHISTDFVFDGSKNEPYTELDQPNPINIYGQTKLNGENEICSNLNSYFIIRTSWLYSEFGHNFMKTMLRLSSERDELNIVNDQIGTPTYAVDLATAILKIISLNSAKYGLYHYSNDGIATWYDFANAIFEINNISITTHPIPSTAFPTPAKRPKYSVLDKSKIKNTFDLEIPHWMQSLQTSSYRLAKMD
jgi:dTDP-4-dehydrorhamnose reductase